MKNSKSRFTLGLALACAAITFSLAVCAQAQTFSYLADFNLDNGYAPQGSMVQAIDGNFYGITGGGGADQWGVLYKLTPSGELSVLYNFCSQPNCADGSYLFQGPIPGSDGNLYGATAGGGSDAGYSSGSGTIYKMTLGGKITTVYDFCTAAPCADGAAPSGLTLASDGNFYGTATVGGGFNEGTIFQIAPSGKFRVLYSFCSLKNCADGERPFYPPIQGRDGNFYGTASTGGATGYGVLYKLTPAGVYTVLHNFCSAANCADGAVPITIVQDAKGNIFGTTQQGGDSGSAAGIVFKLTPTNQFTVLQSFYPILGNPVAGLELANDGNLYGAVTGPGGSPDGGALFEITSTGRLSFPHVFGDVCSLGGYDPWGPLFQGTDGNLYGSTLYGNSTGACANSSGYGTLFKLSNGLSPFVETVPIAGKVGNRVLILGNGLTGTTSVTFNGVPAEFTVESDTYIKAAVPRGATTGAVSVITPAGTLKSNPQFVVMR